MDVQQVSQDNVSYPNALFQLLDADAPEQLYVLGDPDLLSGNSLGIFCSIKAPGGVILHIHDVAQQLKQAPITVIGGFHSPVEREVLRVLLQGQARIVVSPARSIEKMRIRAEYRTALDAGRLAVASPFAPGHHRATEESAVYRNRFVGAMAAAVLVAFAQPGGKTEMLCREMLAWGKPVYTLDHSANQHLVMLGASTVENSADGLKSLVGH